MKKLEIPLAGLVAALAWTSFPRSNPRSVTFCSVASMTTRVRRFTKTPAAGMLAGNAATPWLAPLASNQSTPFQSHSMVAWPSSFRARFPSAPRT
jgi:hypothetical protein